MRVTLFAHVDTAVNPYILLYKETLERQGFVVHLEREFNLRWLITKSRSCDVIHLHWIRAAYKPSRRNIQHSLINKLVGNRFVMPLRGAFRLATFSTALFLAKLQGKVIVYTAHNLKSHGKQSWPFIILNRMAHHVVLLLSNHVHVHNHYTRKVFETVYGRKNNVTVVPVGNYIGCYPNQISRLEARRQLGLSDDSFVYLSFGLLRPYKGMEDLIDAFEKLEWPKGQLLIVGRASKADYAAKISRLARNNPALRLVLEFVPNEAIQLYMNVCNACVLPYTDITTSSAAILALSFGRPIIVPAIASFPELVAPEVGILYDPSQPDALVSALQQARQRSWSEAEIFDYAHQFDWDKLGPRLAVLYQPGRQRLPKTMPDGKGRSQ